MINNPIVFTGPEKAIVDSFNSLPGHAKQGGYWDDPTVTSTRQAIKTHYEEEQSFKCCYCDKTLESSHGRVWDGEHVVAKSSHPKFLFEPRNLSVACVDCNSAKGEQNTLVNPRRTTYPTSSTHFKIVHPHYDEFDDHIAVSLNRFYIPKTRKGENTIAMCRLLRFAYEYLSWDVGLTENPVLVEKATSFLEADTDAGKKLGLLELLMSAQVQISRGLIR